MRTDERSLMPFSEEKYQTIINLLHGTFNVRPSRRTPDQKSGCLKFRRSKNDFDINNDGELTFKNKPVIRASTLRRIVHKEFKSAKGCGARVLAQRLNVRTAGVSEKRVQVAFKKSKLHQRTFTRFNNKSVPKPVTASDVGERWQIDLIDMTTERVESNRTLYRYILQVIDVYSRFIFPRPLKSKISSEVADALKSIIMEHGQPRVIQCDNGKEFDGVVKEMVTRMGIKIIHGRPYHPQSQGKCERSNRTLKQKIRFSTRQKQGFNWASSLLEVSHAINITPKRVLGNQTPFVIYHGRAHGSKYNSHDRRKPYRKSVAEATKRYASRLTRGAKPPSVYGINETVLIRYPLKSSRIPNKRHIIQAKVLDRKVQLHRYKVQFKRPCDNTIECKWVGVDCMTSITKEIEDKKQAENMNTKRKHRDKYYLPLSDIAKKRMQRRTHRNTYYLPLSHNGRNFDIFRDGSIQTSRNPPGNGNCQFDAFAHQLAYRGIHRDAATLRREAADHIAANSNTYAPYVVSDYITYTTSMRKDGTYGDHITLNALSALYNTQVLVISSDGIAHSRLVGSDVYDPAIPVISLGYFPENRGEYYVSVSVSGSALTRFVDYNNNLVACNIIQSSDTDNSSETDDEPTDRTSSVTNDQALDALREQIARQRHRPEHMPREIQAIVIQNCLLTDPSMRSNLRQVNTFFKYVVDGIPLPELYISPDIMGAVPNPCSVQRLIRAAGRGSSLMLAVRDIIGNIRRWQDAWLFLRELDNSWFAICHIRKRGT